MMFYKIFGFSQVIALIILVLLIVWTNQDLGGYGWSLKTRFNYHPLFMMIGYLFLFSHSLLIYRVLRHQPKSTLKSIHGVLHGLSLICVIIAATAVVSVRIQKEGWHLTTAHSWIGLAVIISFVSQFVLGFVAFVGPGLDARARIMPFHVFGGTSIFLLAVVAIITGLVERGAKSVQPQPNTVATRIPSAVTLINTIRILVILFTTAIGYLVTKWEYKRTSLPEEQNILSPEIQRNTLPATAAAF